MSLEKYDVVIVVLTYKNDKDIVDFIQSTKRQIQNYKIIVVNSYYNDIVKNNIEKICNEYNCDFINVENKGYSYGNNIGISYCKAKYKFNYLIVSNPDIEIIRNDFDFTNIVNYPVVFAPVIKNKRQKSQNPYWAYDNKLCEKMIYKGYKYKKKLKLIFGLGVNKILRELFLIFWFFTRKKDKKVYGAHGSFVIFNNYVLDCFEDIYDNNMFLFAEEALLAYKLKKNNIPTYITNKLSILHKEDGSMSISDINENTELSKSVIYYYELISNEKGE